MPVATTVVRPAPFAQGLSYAGFLAKATINRDKFDESYTSVSLTDEDLSFFTRRGSLEVGKLADLAVLSKEYLNVPVDQVGIR